MSVYSVKNDADNYRHRSLQHERRMLDVYRRKAPNDATLLQPLANAGWRAASLEWTLHKEVATVRRLYTEAAAALAQGFSRRRGGFDPSPDQLILAFHFAIAGRARDTFASLASSAPDLQIRAPHGGRAFRGSRAHLLLAESYTLLARALVEQKSIPAHVPQLLRAAQEESDSNWWESQFPDALEVAWRMREHEAVCVLLSIVAGLAANAAPPPNADEIDVGDDQAANKFATVIDATLLRLEEFTNADANHHPKLSVWLPGIALCILAGGTGLRMDWLLARYHAPGYTRLPIELLS